MLKRRRFIAATSAVLVGGCRVRAAEAPPATPAGRSGSPPAKPHDLAVVGGLLFDAVEPRVRPNPGIAVGDGRIVAVGVDPSQARRVIRLEASQVVMPGMFDLHAHLGVELFGRQRVDEVVVNPVLLLANGVTSAFTAGEMNPERVATAFGPPGHGTSTARILRSGPYFGQARPGWRHDAVGEEDVTRDVDRWAKAGVRGFKAKRIHERHLRALIGAAHARGLTVTGHLGSGYRGFVNPRDAIAMGIDRVEHFLGGDALTPDRPAYDSLVNVTADAPEFARIADLYLERGVYFDATISAYGYWGKRDPEVFTKWVDETAYFTPYVRSQLAKQARRPVHDKFERIYWVKRRTIKAFFDRGGGHLITVGTDHPSWGEYLGAFGIHRELHTLVLAGIPVEHALQMATINPARALKLDNAFGTIEPGKIADLVVLAANPVDDVRNTRTPTHVIRGGTVFDPAALLRSVEGQLGPHNAEDAGIW